MALNGSWKTGARAALAAPAFLLCSLAQSSGQLTVGEPAKLAARRGAAAEARIPIAVQPGFHVNSDQPREEYLIPLRLTWTSPGALAPAAIVYPKPALQKYDFSPQPLSVFTGKFEIVVRFKVPAGAPAGPVRIPVQPASLVG